MRSSSNTVMKPSFMGTAVVALERSTRTGNHVAGCAERHPSRNRAEESIRERSSAQPENRHLRPRSACTPTITHFTLWPTP